MSFGNLNFPAVTVTTGLTQLCEYDASDVMSIGIAVENTGVAFNAFELSVKAHQDDAAWTVIASAAGDFSTPVYPLRRTVGTPVTLASGAKGTLLLDTQHLARVRLRASVAATTTSAVVRIGGK